MVSMGRLPGPRTREAGARKAMVSSLDHMKAPPRASAMVVDKTSRKALAGFAVFDYQRQGLQSGSGASPILRRF